MKRVLLHIYFTVFIIFGFTGQSWAFGSLGHHHHGQNSTGQGDSTSSTDNIDNPNNTDDGFDPRGNGTSDHHFRIDTNNFTTNGDNSQTDIDEFIVNTDNSTNDNIPEAPVPEPLTLYLLAIGLTVILLKRRMHGNTRA